jgi:predicted DNA-binding transcriptional regulator AlpA
VIPPKGARKPPRTSAFAGLAWPRSRRGRISLEAARQPLLLDVCLLLRRPGMKLRRATKIVAARQPRRATNGTVASLARTLRRDYVAHPAGREVRLALYIETARLLRHHARANGWAERPPKNLGPIEKSPRHEKGWVFTKAGAQNRRSAQVPESDLPKPLPPPKAAALVGLSVPTFYKAVRSGWLPAPIYPSPHSPRWFPNELLAAVEKTRALPDDHRAARRAEEPAGQGAAPARPPRPSP